MTHTNRYIQEQGMLEKIFIYTIAGFVVILKWLAIVLAPTLALGMVGLIISDIRDVMDMKLIFILMSLGALIGAILAETIRRKYGLIEFDGKLIGHPDIDGHNVLATKSTNS
ncbi:hypothetical protein SVI_1993 [Shewanella violacea DSS12]|uniref:Uncharacterized protein n=2 Tax=Shewanella violacea TaxID=60217 RepID=D4ZJW5_SHEVD|nr:hypothetical protein SVI_1993 [Shewanella violacea DSS12]